MTTFTAKQRALIEDVIFMLDVALGMSQNAAALRAALARVEELERDAARFQWLTGADHFVAVSQHLTTAVHWIPAEELADRIDAAMAERKEQS